MHYYHARYYFRSDDALSMTHGFSVCGSRWTNGVVERIDCFRVREKQLSANLSSARNSLFEF